MTCTEYEGGLTICSTGATREVHRESRGEHWCFGCRRRVEFVYTIRDEVEPSYYEPTPGVECVPAGHHDGDLFPGRFREWWEE